MFLIPVVNREKPHHKPQHSTKKGGRYARIKHPKEAMDFLRFLREMNPDMDTDGREKDYCESPSDFKHPNTMFNEAKITGTEASILHLQGLIKAIQERIVSDVKKLRIAKRAEAKAREKAKRLKSANARLIEHLQNQADINKDRLVNKNRKLATFKKTLEAQGKKLQQQTDELVVAIGSLAEIKSCLGAILKQEETSVEALKAGFEKIMAIMTQSPAEAPAEKTPAEKAKEEPGCASGQ